jgi:excisionase family DNA binding protein
VSADRTVLAQALRAMADVLEREASEARLLTVEAVAARLATSETNVRRLIKRGEIPGLIVGHEGVRVQDVDLQYYIDHGREIGATRRRRSARVAA